MIEGPRWIGRLISRVSGTVRRGLLMILSIVCRSGISWNLGRLLVSTLYFIFLLPLPIALTFENYI